MLRYALPGQQRLLPVSAAVGFDWPTVLSDGKYAIFAGTEASKVCLPTVSNSKSCLNRISVKDHSRHLFPPRYYLKTTVVRFLSCFSILVVKYGQILYKKSDPANLQVGLRTYKLRQEVKDQ